MVTRRTRFRQYMARLDAAADPYLAVERKDYVDRPGSAAERIVRRLELKPDSTHLLVGGIGIGKTTQLLVARDRLNALGDTVAVYIDVSRVHDLGKMKPGSLLAVAGVALGALPIRNAEVPDHEPARKRFQAWAKDGIYDPYFDAPDGDDGGWVPPLIVSPSSGLDTEIKEHLEEFKTLCRSRIKLNEGLVFILDSLDRMTDMQAFASLIEQDVAAITSAGAGLVLAGPIRAKYGLERVIADRFDQFISLSPVDVTKDKDAMPFLVEVLRLRAPDDILGTDERLLLAGSSGGVLRDLINLSRRALEEAYMSAEDRITREHVARAADAFGRTLMIGLTKADLEVLQRVRKKGTFVETSEDDLALLATRRVLEYQNTSVRYSVHPTIAPLLAQLAGEP